MCPDFEKCDKYHKHKTLTHYLGRTSEKKMNDRMPTFTCEYTPLGEGREGPDIPGKLGKTFLPPSIP